MKYAVVKIGGSQYRIKEGDEMLVDRLPQKENEIIELSDVLLTVEDNNVQVGQPLVAEIKVLAKILGHERGEKIRVARFRAKARSRKVRGFRSALTKIRIEKIGDKKEQVASVGEKTAAESKKVIHRRASTKIASKK